MLAHSGDGINGFLLQRKDGVPHLLVRACMFPGNGMLFELGSTVSRANGWAHLGLASQPPFLEYFVNPPAASIMYQGRHSEEGGRFYHYVNQYMIVELPEEHDFALPENFCWMSVDQFRKFNHYGYVNIEGRNMLACLNLTVTFIV
jgi:oxidase EvaA